MKDQSEMNLLFEPRSVAIIGASSKPGKIGYSVVRNIKQGGYAGKIYPVNPQGGEILGIKAYPSINDIDDNIDVASITVPAKLTFEAVKQCADKGVKHIQIITSGFSEIGEVELEKKIVDYARSRGSRVLGPNIFGVFSASSNFNSTFSATDIMRGHVAILTQSGALGIAMIGKTAINNMGLSAIVSIGNKADIDEADCLRYIVNQEETKVILMYIEGIKEGERFIETVRAATKIKPVVVIKTGRSKRGAMAAASHTGSLAGADEITDAILKQCGVLRSENLEEGFNWCKFLADAPAPKGPNGVIVTNGGGIGVMATDACEKYGVELYDDQAVLKEIFAPATPDFGSLKNPIDITGGADSAAYDLVLTAPAQSEHMHNTMALYCETATFDSENLAPMIRDTYNKHMATGTPVVYAIVGGESVQKAIDVLSKEKVPVYADPYEAISCMGALYRYHNFNVERDDSVDEAAIDIDAIEKVIDQALADDRGFLLANEGQDVMRAAGIMIPGAAIAKNIDEAVRHAESIGYPVVMKVVSRDILHKSDAGGVALDILNKNEVLDAYEAIMRNCRSYKHDAVIDGIEICEMVKKGTELIVGARKDPQMGPIVMCGLGGIYVEVMKDVTFRAAAINRREAVKMLSEIRSYSLLLGVRGEDQKDIDVVVDTIIKTATIIRKVPRITDIEINPVVVYEKGKGLKAVDVRILVARHGETDAAAAHH
ncbi:MAG TPA: CoA-binding protein [Spirochaetes bacterium]|nr:CoA-binding protein [Spirochaetota bacterium]